MRDVRFLFAVLLALSSSWALAAGAPAPKDTDPQWRIANIQFEEQPVTNWCWASAAQAVLSTRMTPARPSARLSQKLLAKIAAPILGVRPATGPTLPRGPSQAMASKHAARGP